METGGIWELCFPLSFVVYLKKKKKSSIKTNIQLQTVVPASGEILCSGKNSIN